jgi:hypothetical protein
MYQKADSRFDSMKVGITETIGHDISLIALEGEVMYFTASLAIFIEEKSCVSLRGIVASASFFMLDFNVVFLEGIENTSELHSWYPSSNL